jgi:CRP-like cAMP-binding protein
MPASDTAPRAEGNWLLAALSDDAYRRIAARCETVPATLHDVLYVADAPIDYVYFPQSGCLSFITVMADTLGVEVGTIGWEGMAGLPLLNGITSASTKCIVQVAGTLKRIETEAFLTELNDSDELSRLLHVYAQVWTNQMGRSGSCNAVHAVELRCARWLLQTHDRVDSDVLPLTHEFLAIMLGVRRPSVSIAAASLRKAGLIEYTRGKITVLDRAGLEAASCECYAAIHASYTRQLPTPPALYKHRAASSPSRSAGTDT